MNQETINTEANLVRIRSKKDFKIVINNGYSPIQVAIPGTGRKELISSPADVKADPAKKFLVTKVAVPVNKTYDEVFFEGTIRPVKAYFFFEAPFISDEEDENFNDPNKKLNSHFKLFKKNDVVPVEYMIWRWCHKYHEQLAVRDFSFFVDENNFPLIQWLVQALFNDTRQDYCKLNPSTLSGIMVNLLGKSELIKHPDKVVNTVVGEYDILLTNESFIKDSIAKLEAEIASKQAILASTTNLKKKVIEQTGVTEEVVKAEPVEPAPKKKGRPAKVETTEAVA